MAVLLKHFFGIDFGTTTSATVGYRILGDKHELIPFRDDEGLPMPSVVAIDKNSGEVFTGREAWRKRIELSQSCEYISSVKTILDDDNWNRKIAGEIWTPVDVACEVFKALKRTVSDSPGVSMTSAVVAIPIGFSACKRDKLRKAASMAGIRIKSFVSEPTAAFYANYNELRSSSTVAVFDWGGGTLDVSIIQHANGKISELATGGMAVAGDDLDNKIARRIHTRIARKKDKAVSFEDMPSKARDLLLVRSERAKRALGDDDTATISINDYGIYASCRETLDYDWFTDIISPEVDRAIECLNDTIRESGVGITNIDRIVMIGGSSNLRPLVERMSSKFGDKLFFPDETMWNVGMGAAQLSAMPGAYYSNQSIGLLLSDGEYFELLPRNTELQGWQKEFNFGIVDTSKEARFVFSGSRDIDVSPDKYKSLSVPAYRFLQEQISLRVEVDRDMVFKAMAKSNMRPEDFSRFWDYTKLKCYYKLPEKKVIE